MGISQVPGMWGGEGEDKMGWGLVLTTGGSLAVDEGNPQVRRAGVNDDIELLRGCSNGDVDDVGHLQGSGREVRADLAAWLPSVHSVLPPSGHPKA